MGWLFQHDPLAHETPADHFTREFTHESETTKATVLATATVHGTVYAAIRNPNKQTGYSYVFCAVILFKNSQRDGFGYKDIDETMGPCEVDCPDRIMRLLSPIEHNDQGTNRHTANAGLAGNRSLDKPGGSVLAGVSVSGRRAGAAAGSGAMNHIHRLTAERDALAQVIADATNELSWLLAYLSLDKFARPDNDFVHISTDLMPKLTSLRNTLGQVPRES